MTWEDNMLYSMTQKEKTLPRLLELTTVTENGCMEWQGGKDSNGYGIMKYNGKPTRVTRVIVQLDGREIPSGYQVCHTCDNPPCINPAHLFVGTASDNIQDAIKKGRINRFSTRNPNPTILAGVVHGTKSAFSVGCRCNACYDANRDYMRSYRARLNKG
jgi:hypothetical protein